MMAKAQVANLISKVENGVDEFRNYLEKRGDNARDAASTAQASGRRKRQPATENQKVLRETQRTSLNLTWAPIPTRTRARVPERAAASTRTAPRAPRARSRQAGHSDSDAMDRRVLNTCLYQGFRADLADREEAEIR